MFICPKAKISALPADNLAIMGMANIVWGREEIRVWLKVHEAKCSMLSCVVEKQMTLQYETNPKCEIQMTDMNVV